LSRHLLAEGQSISGDFKPVSGLGCSADFAIPDDQPACHETVVVAVTLGDYFNCDLAASVTKPPLRVWEVVLRAQSLPESLQSVHWNLR
jgi:hypothetical protein